MKFRFVTLLCLVLSVLFTACSGGAVGEPSVGGGGKGDVNVRLAAPTYPQMHPQPDDEVMFEDWDKYEQDQAAWYEDYAKQRDYRDEINQEAYRAFLQATVQEYLCSAGEENVVYSPANIYMALAMLAETTDNESRAQILNLLGMQDIGQLRTQATAMWNANYCDDGVVSSILANSVWLRDGTSYHEEVLNRLAQTYYASGFSGVMGSEEYNQLLRDWIDEQTGGLLKEQSRNLEMSADTVLALASTIYFKSGWTDKFSENMTEQDIFHAPDGDITVDFMHSIEGRYYWGEHYGAVRRGMANGCAMWLILPDDDSSVAEVLADSEMLQMVSGNDWENSKSLDVYLSVPKFDVNAELDLIEGLQNLGVTDVFDPGRSDFTPLTDEPNLAVSEATHAARVKIDEEGCEAAAYTVLMVTEAAMVEPAEQIDLILDRPFIFAITGISGQVLFVGTVCQP